MTTKENRGKPTSPPNDDKLSTARPPHTYLGMAHLFLNGIEPLVAAGSNCAIPLAFVGAQVAECALKAALSMDGDDHRLRSKELRHNLVRLWRLAHLEGVPIAGDPPAWLETLSHLHDSPYYIRYSTGVNIISTPPAADLQRGLGNLFQVVTRHLRLR